MDDSRLERIENKVDKVLEHVASLDVTSARHDEQLKEHLRRSKAAEDAIELMKQTHMKYAIGIISFLAAIVIGYFIK